MRYPKPSCSPAECNRKRGASERREHWSLGTKGRDVKMGFKVQVNAEKTAALSSLHPSDK